MSTLTDGLGPWLDAVASGDATPGGGAVVAVQGAHAVALLEMACRLTRGLAPHAEVLGAHRAAFMRLAEEDARAFGEVSKGYAMPRDTPARKAARTRTIQEALVGALQVPLDTLERVEGVLGPAAKVAEETNPNVASDAGIALALLDATLTTAHYNVRINARFIRDREVGEAALERARARIERARAEIARLRGLIEPHMTR